MNALANNPSIELFSLQYKSVPENFRLKTFRKIRNKGQSLINRRNTLRRSLIKLRQADTYLNVFDEYVFWATSEGMEQFSKRSAVMYASQSPSE